MGVRNQVIVVVAVLVATVAVAANVFAFTHAAEQYAENNRIAAEPTWAQPLDSSTTTEQAPTEPSVEPVSEPSVEPANDDVDEPCTRRNQCAEPGEVPGDFSNHGRWVSSFASDPDFKSEIDGPPGAIISGIARSDIGKPDPSRSDGTEENHDPSTPPGQEKDKTTPPGQDKDKTAPPGQDKKDQDG